MTLMVRIAGATTKRQKQANTLDLAWTAMRIHTRFTTSNIRATTGIGKNNLDNYIRALRRAGYIKLERPRESGKTLGHAIWRLVRNTGPRHPLPRKDQTGMWDQNQQKLYPYPEESKDG
jgi:hypothetical protein